MDTTDTSVPATLRSAGSTAPATPRAKRRATSPARNALDPKRVPAIEAPRPRSQRVALAVTVVVAALLGGGVAVWTEPLSTAHVAAP